MALPVVALGASDPVPEVMDWTTDPATGIVHFDVRWHNQDPQSMSNPVMGSVMSQPFGVFQQDFGLIGNFDVPPLAPDSFFDIVYDISLSDLPPGPRKMLPGGGPQGSPGGPVSAPGGYAAADTIPPCPPDDHWDGNVDVVWAGAAAGQVNVHYGSLLVCPGGGSSYIHIPSLACSDPNGATWQVAGLCPGFNATLVNEDFTPAPANLLPTWSGWICVSATAGVPIGLTCCLDVLFDCGGVPAKIELCATTCDWAPAAPDPVPQVMDWTTDPTTGEVVFQLRWHNVDLQNDSHPVSGSMMSQPFGVFQQDFGLIGNFEVPTLAPDSFFDIEYRIDLASLPPGPSKVLPGGGGGPVPGGYAAADTIPPCPPDDHWDGNVDVTWTGSTGGEVNVHYGSLLVCPGGGSSYIHIPSLACSDPNGTTWQVAGLCPGFNATLVNEDFTPAPPNLLPTWSGWICVNASAGVPIGLTCCLDVLFDCGGVPAKIELCATTCDWNPNAPDPVPEVMDWTTDPNGTVHFQLRWHNADLQNDSHPVSGSMMSQPFGVFQQDFGLIGNFEVPTLAPDSFFDIAYDIDLASLPPGPSEILPGGGPPASPGGLVSAPGGYAAADTIPPCPPDDHWDGNVDVVWAGADTGQVNVHYGSLRVCPGAGSSYIHIPLLDCAQPVAWQVAGLCQGFTGILVNEDFTAAPANLPVGWTGWICVAADVTVPIGQQCCPQVTFTCPSAPGSGQPGISATITLCVTACDWTPKDPTLQVMDWTTDPANGTVHFQLHWQNKDTVPSSPVSGSVMSQPFGVFQQDFGLIGNFNVPTLAPDSFFDIEYDISLSSLPPAPSEILPGGGPSAPGALAPDANPPCPPDDHWDGNVDVTWTGAAGGQVNVHYGTLLVCPGAGSSYIHIPLLDCTQGVTWQLTGVCQGFTVTLANEDLTPAPGVLPVGWTGWICVTADASVPIGQQCCPQVVFTCPSAPGSGQPGTSAAITLCAVACDWSTTDIRPTPEPPAFAIQARPNPMFGSTTLYYTVPRAGDVRVEIFDTAGRLIRKLVDGPAEAGTGSVAWNGRGDHGEPLPAGVYVARLSLDYQTTAKKVLIMK